MLSSVSIVYLGMCAGMWVINNLLACKSRSLISVSLIQRSFFFSFFFFSFLL